MYLLSVLAWDTNLKLMKKFSFQAEAGLQVFYKIQYLDLETSQKKYFSATKLHHQLDEVEQFINPVSREPNFPPPLSSLPPFLFPLPSPLFL